MFSVAKLYIVTEPPVEAVSDIVDALSQNKKLEDFVRRSTVAPEDDDKTDGKAKSLLASTDRCAYLPFLTFC